jgi:hypothetical protein
MDSSRPGAGAGGPTWRGELRIPGAPGGTSARAGNIALGDISFTLAAEGVPPATIAYRDLATIAVDHEVGLLVVGTGVGAERWLLDRFGPGLGPLVGALRERRLRQLLGDALVEVPDGPIDLVEYGLPDGSSGVALLVVHGWGLVVAPLDEAAHWVRLRRARIGAVAERREVGGVRVHDATGAPVVDLLRLGPAAARHRIAIEALRDGAALDAGRIVEALVPDLSYPLRRRAADALVDGTPADAAALADGWSALEASVLSEPVFAASYAAIVERAGPGAPRWLAVAPAAPGSGSTREWFFVGLPGNLVALELVSAGAHATYLFRVVARAERGPGDPTGAALAACVADLSDALVDARFLREPMALPADRLAAPDARRYRLALAAIPSLAAARRRFVARIVHADAATWAAALDDLVAWHDGCRDEDAVWPGRAGQEAAVSSAGGDDGAGAALLGPAGPSRPSAQGAPGAPGS